ncbi:sugar ABC transporter substrate-binding protein [Brachybacterium endophyticum]|uniref:Sugar ABC transporter substrate-binding protein n=1 Tax=Brachybacterium endophyticum TaxID=2182385 RepID=A0A2U2RK65_9MICO|nr:extracellular solute-binding protein [Brachybacterium endophyticum]PWH06250.1 sugar ABC transporter substrate-binding protein [Brachybacterium endophyticum]
MPTRRQALGLSLTVPALWGLAACGPNQSSSSSGGGGAGSLRFMWWGNAIRDDLTRKAIDAYKDVQPDLTISGEPADWSGYWDKLATQVAGGDMPEVIQMDEKYLSEYGNRGALLELADAGLDTSDFEDTSVKAGEVPDKGLLAINAGVNTPVLLANPAVFEKAGVDLPDDTTWTWDDLIDRATRITEKSAKGVYGIQQIGLVQATFQVYMRQFGKDQYATDGAGFSAEDAEEFFAYAQKLQDTKASPGASLAVEEAGQSVDQSMFSTGKTAMQVAWSNQVVAFDAAAGGDVRVLRMPSMTGRAADAQLWYKASMYFAVAAKASDPKQAVAFVDWLVNSPDAGKQLLAERGVPANLEVRKAIEGDLTESDRKAVDFIEDIAGELGETPVITPQGGGEFEDILKRCGEDLLFGRQDAKAAGKALLDQLTSAISV